jgi:hypothetical protein
MSKHVKQNMSVAELDAWAAEANEIAAARKRIVNDPRLTNKLYSLARKGAGAELGSERGARKRKEHTVRLETALIAAVKKVGDNDPDTYFRGQRFRRQAACKRVLLNIPEEVQQVLTAEKVDASLANFRRWTKTLRDWTRAERDRALLDPHRRLYLDEKRKRASR